MSVSLKLGLSIVLVLATAACSGGSTAAPIASPLASAASSPVPTQSALQTGSPSSGPKTLQTDTAWGRIWDGLPSGFPIYPNAKPDDEASAGAASAVLVVEGHAANEVAAFLQTQLRKAGYTAVGSAEPLEDGSVVLDMTGAPTGCKLQVSVTPTGGLTSVTVLYGAACPLD